MRIQKYILTVLGFILLFPTMTFSQSKKIKYEHTQLNEHTYIITRTGSSSARRSNMGVIIGEKGLLLINPLFRGNEADQFMNTLQKISDKPVKYVINSNWDNYNVAANWYFKDKFITDVVLDKDYNYWFSTLKNGIFIIPNEAIKNYNNVFQKVVLTEKKDEKTIFVTYDLVFCQ